MVMTFLEFSYPEYANKCQRFFLEDIGEISLLHDIEDFSESSDKKKEKSEKTYLCKNGSIS